MPSRFLNYIIRIYQPSGEAFMRIAICDDESRDLLQIALLIEAYRRSRKAEIVCVSFKSAAELLSSMDREEYDVLFLDVLLPGLSGMEAAREIREKNGHVEIIFLTSSPEYAVESYCVRAHYYFLKPASAEKLFPVLDRLMDRFRRPEDALRIKTQSHVFSLPYGSMECVEVMSKKLYFHMADGSVREVPGNLTEYEQALLKRPGFIKVHSSYLVSLQWVQELRRHELVTASGHCVPVSRTEYPKVRAAYLDFLFEEAQKPVQNAEDGAKG